MSLQHNQTPNESSSERIIHSLMQQLQIESQRRCLLEEAVRCLWKEVQVLRNEVTEHRAARNETSN
jgi:hypothetical protein